MYKKFMRFKTLHTLHTSLSSKVMLHDEGVIVQCNDKKTLAHNQEAMNFILIVGVICPFITLYLIFLYKLSINIIILVVVLCIRV